MKKEFVTKDSKFVYSKNELGYREVLDDFENASEITIITYNISEKELALVSALREAGERCKINIITNIPSRWEIYYGDTFRDKAKQKINLYLSKLNPNCLGINSKVFFDFSNHGKIIMTDHVVYVGSANYSEESAKNTEFSFISRDKELIDYISSEVLPDIQASAIPYYEYDYTSLLLEANVALLAIFEIKNELYEEVYSLHDDVDGEWYYYVEYEASLTVDTLNKVVQIIHKACEIACNIYDAIDNITSSDEYTTTEANDKYEKLLTLSSRIKEVRGFDTLIKLSQFDSTEYVNHQLEEEYAMEAYEEDLENCIARAFDKEMNVVQNLTQSAKKDIDELIEDLQKFCEVYSSIIEKLLEKEIKKVSSEIDNT